MLDAGPHIYIIGVSVSEEVSVELGMQCPKGQVGGTRTQDLGIVALGPFTRPGWNANYLGPIGLDPAYEV